jgi:hypothetical protein
MKYQSISEWDKTGLKSDGIVCGLGVGQNLLAENAGSHAIQ